MSQRSHRELNELINRLDPREFDHFVYDILRTSMTGFKLLRESGLGPIRVDVLAEPENGSRGPVTAFEIKKAAVVSVDVILAQVGRRESIWKRRPECQFILVLGGDLTEPARKLAIEHNLAVWGVDQLESRLDDAVRAKWFGFAGSAKSEPAEPEPTPAEALIAALKFIPAGDVNALEYQQWVADSMEHLFVPPLGPVHYESTDTARRNRRDVILENWAQDGFWAQVRTIYNADQVVIDAKNSGKPLTKRPVVDIAHYLKPYGCGLFGILSCRLGAAQSAKHAIREQWIGGQKMVLVLSDEIMIQMLQRKAAGKPPEELLRKEIAHFRKSL